MRSISISTAFPPGHDPEQEHIYVGGKKRPATREEVQRVRETECDHWGHDYQVVTVFESADPQSCICGRCGKSWRVVAAEEQTDDQLEEGAR